MIIYFFSYIFDQLLSMNSECPVYVNNVETVQTVSWCATVMSKNSVSISRAFFVVYVFANAGQHVHGDGVSVFYSIAVKALLLL